MLIFILAVTIGVLGQIILRRLQVEARLRQFERAKATLRNAIGHRLDIDASASRMLECALIAVKFEELHFRVESGAVYAQTPSNTSFPWK